jgi:EmrB/QacA subfamily drug resistance transporter
MNPARVTTKRAGAALALVCGAQFVLQLDFSIVNVALPAIQRELRFAPAELQWVVTGYALTFGSLLLVGGRSADLLGRRALLELGLVLFGLASLACGLAQSPLMLIVARFVQGAAGAMVSPAALSLLTTLYREGPERTRALGLWQAATAGGATTGIIAGGLLTQFIGWRAIFLVNPPLLAVMLVLVRRVLPTGQPEGGQRLDVPGAVLVTASLAALIFGLSNGQQHGFGAPATIATLAAAVLLGAGFVATERRVAAPMLPFAIFSAPTRRAASAAMLLMGAIIAAYVYFVSLYLQRVLGFSPVATGLSLVPSTATVVLTTTFGTRRLLQRFGVKTTLLAGLALAAGGQFWLAHVSADGTYVVNVLPGLLVTALGVGLVFPTASVAITSGVQQRDQGLAGGLFSTSQQVGAATGLAILATIAAARTVHAHGSLAAGYRLSFMIATGIALVAAAFVARQLYAATRQSELARQEQSAPDAAT